MRVVGLPNRSATNIKQWTTILYSVHSCFGPERGLELSVQPRPSCLPSNLQMATRRERMSAKHYTQIVLNERSIADITPTCVW